ncbi:MAG: oligosaccharide flippase family protein [Burkholderiales bacterium]|nr:oligosaccharide flippase family protein [Burkholderiales bacterium]
MRAPVTNLVCRPFVRNVATVATGAAASQVITMAFAPIVTRLYGPEAYGLQGIFMTVVGLLTTVAALGYPTALVLPRSDADARGIARLSLYLGLIVTAAVILLLASFGKEFLALLNAEAISPFLYLIPAAMMISVLAAVLGQWLIRKKAFRIIASYGVATALLLGAIKTMAGLINPSALALIAANVFGGLVGAALTFLGWRHASRSAEPEADEKHVRRTLWQLAKQHGDFPTLRTPQNLINAFSHSLPVLLLANFFGAASAGQYGIAVAVLGLPTSVIGGSVTAVFYPRINEAIRRGENARALIVKATMGMAATGALPFVVILVAGPILFAFVFGKEWYTAGVYAQLLALWLFFQYINRPAVSAIPVLRLQGRFLIYELFSTGTKLLALWLGFVHFKSEFAAIALFSLFGVLAYAWLILWVIHRSGDLPISDDPKAACP